MFLLLVFGAAWAGVRVALASTDAGAFRGQEYVVRDGDTLWEVAASEYGYDLDLRRAVYEIQVANDLGAAAIQPGQRLTLPRLGE